MTKFVGGYDVLLEGKPSDELAAHAKVDALHLPLFSRRLQFTSLLVKDGETVMQGQVLAIDPDHYSIPLLAPEGGTVDLETVENHITLKDLSGYEQGPSATEAATGPEQMREKLVRCGIWQCMAIVASDKIPDPKAEPGGLIIPISRFEPFFPSPEAFLAGQLDNFTAGLGQLQDALDEPAIYLILPSGMPGICKELARVVKEQCGWAKLVEVPEKYPNDSPALMAQSLGLDPETVWTVDAQAVIGVQQALMSDQPYLTRVVSAGGPKVKEPRHYSAPIGYPLSALVNPGSSAEPIRLIDGGALTGRMIEQSQKGLDIETTGITVLQENTEREVLAFAQVGLNKQSFSKAFASALKPVFREKYTTALRGEARPCVFCGYCESVCPAGLIPHVIYRYLTKDFPEEALRAGLQQCVGCGLCSYVCLSKIEHLEVFLEEKAKLTNSPADS